VGLLHNSSDKFSVEAAGLGDMNKNSTVMQQEQDEMSARNS